MAKPAGAHSQPRGGALPSWIEPQLATLTHERFSDPAWIFERKLDGERCLAFAGSGGVRLMSRRQQDITSRFPEVAGALAGQGAGDLVADGEIVAFDGAQTRFGRLQQRLGVAHPPASLLRAVPVYYYLFDLPYAAGQDHDHDGDLVYAGKVGTGFDTHTLRSLHDRLAKLRRSQPAFRHGRLPPRRGVHWVQPRLVGQIAFTEWTGDGQLRHPRFQGLHDDKDPAEVVREVPS